MKILIVLAILALQGAFVGNASAADVVSSASNETVATQSLDLDALDHSHWVCVARGEHGREFRGEGRERHHAEARALEECREHSRHDRRHCHIEHCHHHR